MWLSLVRIQEGSLTFIGDVVMAKRGRKDCSNCKAEIGARCHLCPECGFHFSEGEIRLDLLEEKKNKAAAPVFYDKPGRGRKECPGCSKIVGGVTKTCPGCSFDFVAAREETRSTAAEKKEKKPDKKEEKIDPRVRELLALPEYTAPKQLSPVEHAQRILGYGVERAKALLNLARNNGYWKHVNWDVVEEGL